MIQAGGARRAVCEEVVGMGLSRHSPVTVVLSSSMQKKKKDHLSPPFPERKALSHENNSLRTLQRHSKIICLTPPCWR